MKIKVLRRHRVDTKEAMTAIIAKIILKYDKLECLNRMSTKSDVENLNCN